MLKMGVNLDHTGRFTIVIRFTERDLELNRLAWSSVIRERQLGLYQSSPLLYGNVGMAWTVQSGLSLYIRMN